MCTRQTFYLNAPALCVPASILKILVAPQAENAQEEAAANDLHAQGQGEDRRHDNAQQMRTFQGAAASVDTIGNGID